jgi:hypothetical protein
MNPDRRLRPAEIEDGTVFQERVDRRRALGILLVRFARIDPRRRIAGSSPWRN